MILTSTQIKEIAQKIGSRPQAALAEEVGVLQPALNRWICGKTMPIHWNVVRLSEALGVGLREMEAYLELQHNLSKRKRPASHRKHYLKRRQPESCPRCRKRF